MGSLLSSYFPPALPTSVDLRPTCTPVYAQGRVGSCTANALCGLVGQIAKQRNVDFSPSRMFLYYQERFMNGDENENVGAHINNGVAVLTELGVCCETLLPYLLSNEFSAPSEAAILDAQKHVVTRSHFLKQELAEVKSSLAAGQPFVFAFQVYDNFGQANFAQGAVMLMPTIQSVVTGKHAVLAVGYDDEKEAILVKNSWSASWGMEGYFWMPYEFLLNPKHCNSLWTIDHMEGFVSKE